MLYSRQVILIDSSLQTLSLNFVTSVNLMNFPFSVLQC